MSLESLPGKSGLGPGAHSLTSARIRSWNTDELSGWTVKGESLTDRELWEEELMLGLRTADGIPASLLTDYPPEDEDNYTPGEYIPDPQFYISMLVPSTVPGNLRIPEDRWFTADDIISELLNALF